MASRRTPLSLISANASHQTPSSTASLKKKGVPAVSRRSSSTSLPSTTTQSSKDWKKKQIELTCNQKVERRNLQKDDDGERFSFVIDDVINIFRKRTQLSYNVPFETTIQRASPIYDTDVIHASNEKIRSPTEAIQIFHDNRADSSCLMSLYKSLKNEADESLTAKKTFLEPPNEQFFSEGMEMMLTLQLGNPVCDSDSDSDASEELSVNGC